MWPGDCPRFEYEDHRDHRERLHGRSIELVLGLRRKTLQGISLVRDSRPVHQRLLEGLTPIGCDYYAGHYRGESFRCLLEYSVRVQRDPRVGTAPQLVLQTMETVAALLANGFQALDAKQRDTTLSQEAKLFATVSFACAAFVQFLTIHPYANGNGHIARFLTWAILGRYGYWPREWTIDPRPTYPDYEAEIIEHRNGNPLPLIQHMLQDIVR